MTSQLFRPAVFLLFLVAFAFSSMAGNPPAGTVRTEWTPPTETGVGWDSGDYAYDDSGNIVSIGRDKFAYDGVNRLKAGSVNAHGVVTSQSFGYDRYGNLLGIATTIANGSDFPTADGVTFSVSAATNRLDSVCHPTRGCETWTYDDDSGNLTRNQKRIGGALVYDVAYDWDATGAMTELDSGNAHERYVYDANDERVVMVSLDGDDEIIRRWTWRDGTNKVVREAVEHVGTDRWSEPRDYVYRNGSLLAAFESSTATVAERHYHVDHLGTPRLITDAGRHKLAIEVYLPFGERAPGGEAAYIGFKERMRFTGHERDGDGSPYRPTLDYMHARYYTPEWGRFLSVDRAPGKPALPQSWNRYAYTFNNPLRLVDPDGNDPRDAIIHVTVNVVYDRDIQPAAGYRSVRDYVEAGIVDARDKFATIGVALEIRRFDGGQIKSRPRHDGGLDIEGSVSTADGQVDWREFVADRPNAVTVLVGSDMDLPGNDDAGVTDVKNHVVAIGPNPNDGTLAHELAHAFGNVAGGNHGSDIEWGLQKAFLNVVGRFTKRFEKILRDGADAITP